MTLRSITVLLLVATGLISSSFGQRAAGLQLGGRNIERGMIAGQGIGLVRFDNGFPRTEVNNDPLRYSAIPRTDPELESILEMASRYQAEQNWDIASQLWQAVLERSNGALVSENEILYRSMIDQVERILADLPTEGLAVYRINADASAREILARGGDPYDVDSLARVTDRYFSSSTGDNAALRLAAVFMDRHEFIAAERLLTKIIERHPDPDVDRNELYARLAVCQALTGNPGLARETLNSNPEIMGTKEGRAAGETVARLETGGDGFARRMVGGSFASWRVQPGLPDSFLDGDLTASWQFAIDPAPSYKKPDMRGRVVTSVDVDAGAGTFAERNVTSAEQLLIRQWKSGKWRPAGQLPVNDQFVFFRTPANVIAWDLNPQEEIAWSSAWLNKFQPDASSQFRILVGEQGGFRAGRNTGQQSSETPSSEMQIQLFGDQIFSSLALSGNYLFCLEGASYDEKPPSTNRREMNIWGGMQSSFGRTNYLVAYEASTGRALWRVPSLTDADGQVQGQGQGIPGQSGAAANPAINNAAVNSKKIDSGGFVGMPLCIDDVIYAPLSDAGALYACCLQVSTGEVLWRSFLCDRPASGNPEWPPSTITADGSELFVGTGMGIVFCLDRVTGSIRFAHRYPRTGTQDFSLRQFGMGNEQYMLFRGWSENTIIPWGREMICISSDSGTITSIDRRTGETIWYVDNKVMGEPFDYILGISDRKLFVAGTSTIVAFDLDAQGRMLWGGDTLFGKGTSFGRGVLTESGIFIPVENEIWQFAISPPESSPEPLRRIPVGCGFDTPLGNLTSDGKRIWVHNGNRILRLESSGEKADSRAQQVGQTGSVGAEEKFTGNMDLNKAE